MTVYKTDLCDFQNINSLVITVNNKAIWANTITDSLKRQGKIFRAKAWGESGYLTDAVA